MAKYTGIIVLDSDVNTSDITNENYIKVRIPALHGPSKIDDYTDSNVPENLRYRTEDGNLPYAHILRPIGTTGIFTPHQYFQNGDIVLVESVNDDLNNLLVMGKISDYTATSDKQVIQNRIDGVASNVSGGTNGSGSYSTDGSQSPAFQYGTSLISVAKSQIGVHEEGFTNKVKYNDELWHKGAVGGWCCSFVWWCFNKAKLSQYYYGGGKTGHPPTLKSYHDKAGDSVTSNYKAGDVLFMNFNGGNTAAHVGIAIEDQVGNKIKTVEGNTSSAETEKLNGGQVMEKNRNLNVIVGGFRPGKSMGNEYQCFAFFVSTMGLNNAAACGILANIEKESSFNPKSNYLEKDGYYSYGICQWHKGRYDIGDNGLVSWCKRNDLDYTSLIGQLSYLRHELENGYIDVLNKLSSVTNDSQGAYDAGYYWCYHFEVPANYPSVSVTRGNLAKTKYWPKYQNKTVDNS